MGGFLGIGTSPQEKALKEQKKQARAEAERSRRSDEIALAERQAKKGAETAQIQLGDEAQEATFDKAKDSTKKLTNVSKTLGLGGASKTKRRTGVQI